MNSFEGKNLREYVNSTVCNNFNLTNNAVTVLIFGNLADVIIDKGTGIYYN